MLCHHPEGKMSLTTLDQQPITAREEDISSLTRLEDVLGQPAPGTTNSQLISASGEAINLPQPVLQLLRQMVHELLQGHSVTIVPIHKKLTTQEAADILNVSRQYLVELLDAQAIPYHKVGTHRRIRFGDLMNYKNDRDTKRQIGLSQMTQKSQKLGLYTKAAQAIADQQTPGQ
jgi:excisionase family DNA binding protein